MNVALQFRRATAILVLTSIAAFAASQRSGWVLVVAGTLAVAAIRLTHGPIRRALPGWLVRISVLILIGWGGSQFLSQPSADEAPWIVGYVVLGALLLKLWDRQSPADWRQIMVLSIVLVVAAALSSTDFLVGVLVIGYAIITVASTMLYHIYAGAERAIADRRAAAFRQNALAPLEAPHGVAPARHFRRLAVAGVLLGIFLSLLIFVMFPRDSAFGSGSAAGRQSGFRSDVTLWSGGRVSLSSRIAMTAVLLDPRGTPGPLTLPLRLRGAVLNRYSVAESQWRRGGGRSIDRAYQTGALAGVQWFSNVAKEEKTNVWTQVIEMRSLASEHLFSAWLPLSIACEESRTFLFDPRSAEITEAGAGISGRPRKYQIQLQAFPSQALARAVVGASPPAEVDFPVERIREIAQKIIDESSLVDLPDEAAIRQDPSLAWVRKRQLAALFQEYLSSPRFRYTTDLSSFRRVGDIDPNVLFLDRYRFGHCEYFASAMAALCRSMGMEARVVTGFMATEYDATSDRYIFRESGAHAWAEVRTSEWQWGTYDPSPIQEVLAIQQANRTWMDSFRWILDPVEFAWNSRFASFDSRAQSELVDSVTVKTRGLSEWITEQFNSLIQSANAWFRLGPAGAIWLGLVGVTAVIAVMAVKVLLRRIRRVDTDLGGHHQSVKARLVLTRNATFYLAALDALEHAGMPKPRSRTPRAHVDVLRTLHPEAAQAFAIVVERFYEIRYGGRACTRAQRAAADGMVVELRRVLVRGYT